MYRTLPLFACLISFLLLLPSCSENASSNNKGDTLNAPQAFANTGKDKRGKDAARKYKARHFSLNAEKNELILSGKDMKPQRISTKGQVVTLSFNEKDMPTLNEVKIGEKPVVVMGRNGPFCSPFSMEKLDLSIDANQQGGWTLSDQGGDFSLDVSPYDCEDIYITSEEGTLYLANPPKPITVTVDGYNLNFLREGKSEGLDVPHETGVILAPCDELLSEPRSFVYQGGGLGTVILVDNIIDPELVEQAQKGDAFQAEAANAFLQSVKKLDEQYKGAPCPSIDDKKWSDAPVISIQFAFSETSMTIYCDTWLVIEDGSEKRCINIVTCGAKLEVDGDIINVYSGCPDDPSQDCP